MSAMDVAPRSPAAQTLWEQQVGSFVASGNQGLPKLSAYELDYCSGMESVASRAKACNLEIP